jgi:hypothetical protein
MSTHDANSGDCSPRPADEPSAAAALTRAGFAFFALHVLTWLAGIAQLLIDYGYDNLICTCFVMVSSSATFIYLRVTRALREVPLSAVAVLGLCITTQWGALFAQSVLLDSLTANLRVPLQTFGYLLGFQLTALAAHWVSRRMAGLMAARRLVAEVLFVPLGVFRVPSVQALWCMGLVGLIATLGAGSGEGGLLSKVAAGFGVVALSPFVIPLLSARLGPTYARMGRQWPYILAFALAVALMGLAFNARAQMLGGVVTGMLLYAIVVLNDERPFRLVQLKYLGGALMAVAVLTQPLSYFFNAMQAARDQRDKISRVEMIKYTLEKLQDPVAVKREVDRMSNAAVTGAYDEYYFKFSMLGRLVETKFHDNAFYMVQGVSPVESHMLADDAMDRVWAILPYPVLKWLGQERSKFVTLYSVGDLLANLRLGLELGAFVTGSMFAQGIAIFGVWTPFLYFLICLPVFVVWDVLARPGQIGEQATVSVIGMLLIYRLFAYGIVTESIGNIVGVLLRSQLQNVLLYALVFAATRLIWKPFDANAPALPAHGPSPTGPAVSAAGRKVAA